MFKLFEGFDNLDIGMFLFYLSNSVSIGRNEEVKPRCCNHEMIKVSMIDCRLEAAYQVCRKTD